MDITFKQGSKDMTLYCTVTVVEPNHRLAWKYHVMAPFLFRGEHNFTIEPLGEGKVRLVDVEVFEGLLIPLQARDIDTNSRRDFENMDRALKARGEA